MNDYVKRLAGLIGGIPKERIGALEPNEEKIRIPTQAFSEFLINRELGNWAEDVVRRGIEAAGLGLHGVRYGRSENLIAGEPGFKEFYVGYITELRQYGKRPDILIYGENPPDEAVISGKMTVQLISVAKRAIAGIEVRSSQQSLGGTRTPSDLSFTPKIEDIANVWRWINHHGVRHYYVQVIFGAVYAISFEKILELLVVDPSEGGYTINREPRNQFKSTIYIPLSLGVRLSTSFTDPALSTFKRQLSTGRMLFGVKFSDGDVTLDQKVLKRLLVA